MLPLWVWVNMETTAINRWFEAPQNLPTRCLAAVCILSSYPGQADKNRKERWNIEIFFHLRIASGMIFFFFFFCFTVNLLSLRHYFSCTQKSDPVISLEFVNDSTLKSQKILSFSCDHGSLLSFVAFSYNFSFTTTLCQNLSSGFIFALSSFYYL